LEQREATASDAEQAQESLTERVVELEEGLADTAARRTEILDEREELEDTVVRVDRMARPVPAGGVTRPSRADEAPVEAGSAEDGLADVVPGDEAEAAPREPEPVPVTTSIEEVAETREAAIAALQRRFPNGSGVGADDLTLIAGIGPLRERMLNTVGIRTYRDVAALTKEDVANLAVAFASQLARVRRSDWIQGARAAHLEVHGTELGAGPSS
ncbi:MAG TPA: hypothetical protein VLD62_12450, partial [Acidimicrobiia bacterium]|nr:hypothetical protein [Acidimicrobiia bacterium]